MRYLILILLALIWAGPAQARHRHHHRHHAAVQAASTENQVIGGRPPGCPRAFCGCSASLKIFGRIIPELNLAANWGKFPPASPGPGMAAWRKHHVFVILAVNSDGTVLAHDGNSGKHLTRIHAVKLNGYRVVDPHGVADNANARIANRPPRLRRSFRYF